MKRQTKGTSSKTSRQNPQQAPAQESKLELKQGPRPLKVTVLGSHEQVKLFFAAMREPEEAVHPLSIVTGIEDLTKKIKLEKSSTRKIQFWYNRNESNFTEYLGSFSRGAALILLCVKDSKELNCEVKKLQPYLQSGVDPKPIAVMTDSKQLFQEKENDQLHYPLLKTPKPNDLSRNMFLSQILSPGFFAQTEKEQIKGAVTVGENGQVSINPLAALSITNTSLGGAAKAIFDRAQKLSTAARNNSLAAPRQRTGSELTAPPPSPATPSPLNPSS